MKRYTVKEKQKNKKFQKAKNQINLWYIIKRKQTAILYAYKTIAGTKTCILSIRAESPMFPI